MDASCQQKVSVLTWIEAHSSRASLICVTSKKFLLFGMPRARMPFWWRHSLKWRSKALRPQ